MILTSSAFVVVMLVWAWHWRFYLFCCLIRLIFQKMAKGKKYPAPHNPLSESDTYCFLSYLDWVVSKRKGNAEVGVICAEVNVVNSFFTNIIWKTKHLWHFTKNLFHGKKKDFVCLKTAMLIYNKCLYR